MFKESNVDSTRDLFESETMKESVAKLLKEKTLSHQKRRILKFLIENPNCYTHEIREACSSGHPTLRMRELEEEILFERGLRISGKAAPKSYRNKFGEHSSVHSWTIELL